MRIGIARGNWFAVCPNPALAAFKRRVGSFIGAWQFSEGGQIPKAQKLRVEALYSAASLSGLYQQIKVIYAEGLEEAWASHLRTPLSCALLRIS